MSQQSMIELYIKYTQLALQTLTHIIEDDGAIQYCRERPEMLALELKRCDEVLAELNDQDLQQLISTDEQARKLSDEFYEKTSTLKRLLLGPSALN